MTDAERRRSRARVSRVACNGLLGFTDDLDNGGRANKHSTFLNAPRSTWHEMLRETRPIQESNHNIAGLTRCDCTRIVELNLPDI
jgi:hypothetical protein